MMGQGTEREQELYAKMEEKGQVKIWGHRFSLESQDKTSYHLGAPAIYYILLNTSLFIYSRKRI